MATKKDTNFLKEFLRLRIPILVKKFIDINTSQEVPNKIENMCSFETLQNLIKSFNVPLKYTHHDVMNSIYEEFKSDDTKLFNYQKFLDHIVNFKDNNDFFNFKEKFVEGLVHRIENDKNTLKELEAKNPHLIIAEEKLKKEKADVLKEQIENKEKKEPLNVYDTKFVRNSQPNKDFMMQSFANKDNFKKQIEETKKSFEPNQLLMKGI